MKKTVFNQPLRAALWTALVVTLVGVSACSSEKKEETAVDSGEVLTIDQGNDTTEYAGENATETEHQGVEATSPMTTGEANMTTEADMIANDGEASVEADMDQSTGSGTTDKSVTETTENTNANKTAADGLQ